MPNTESLRPDQQEGHAKPSPVPPPLCTHIMPSGATCGSCAVSGTALCYHHSAVKTALGKAANAPNIPFVFPEDRTSLQINFFLLLQAYTQRRIDLRTFNSMQRLLRAMASNLGNKPLAEDTVNAPENSATKNHAGHLAPQKEEKEAKKPAAAHMAASLTSPQNNADRKSANPPISFEAIAAGLRPLRAECFLNTPSPSSSRQLAGI